MKKATSHYKRPYLSLVIISSTIAFLSLALNGCAVSYTLPNGDNRVLGLVALTIQGAGAENTTKAFSIKNLGAVTYHHSDDAGISIGYTQLSHAAFADNSCFINPRTN